MKHIEWTDYSYNFTRGCSRVSEGCRNCYAERIAARFSRGPWRGFAAATSKGPRWTGRVELIEAKLGEALRKRSWKGKRVFANSASDLFHDGLSDEDIDKVFAVMAMRPDVTFQVLTKRPERMRRYLAAGRHTSLAVESAMRDFDLPANGRSYPRYPESWPLHNVWLGVSVEDQRTADERIPILLETPAAVRFVSAEPLLEAISMDGRSFGGSYLDLLDWLIIGAESGPGARPMSPRWAKRLVRECEIEPRVPVFVKQLCEKGRAIPFEEWPTDLQVREFPC